MRTFPFCLFLLFCAVVTPHAQIVVEEEIEETEVNILEMEESGKSRARAVFASALLPGMGEMYLEKRERASWNFFGEALGVVGFVVAKSFSRQYFEDAKAYAYLHAGARAGVEGKDKAYYEDLALFRDIWEHAMVYRSNREFDKMYPQNGDWAWRWENRERQREFEGLMRQHRAFEMVAKGMIGAMVLHRFVSMIDASRLAKRYHSSGALGVRFHGGTPGLALSIGL